jgi:hypothetical protein
VQTEAAITVLVVVQVAHHFCLRLLAQYLAAAAAAVGSVAVLVVVQVAHHLRLSLLAQHLAAAAAAAAAASHAKLHRIPLATTSYRDACGMHLHLLLLAVMGRIAAASVN